MRGALVFGILGMTLPFLASAQERSSEKRGFYIGAGVGAGRIEADMNDLGLSPSGTTAADCVSAVECIEGYDFDSTTITSKFFAGYRILDYLAIEGGFVEFHEPDESHCFIDIDDTTRESLGCSEERPGFPSIISSGAWTVELPTEGFTVYVVGIYPFNDSFEVFGKVGAFFWEIEAEAKEQIIGGFIPPDPPFIPPTNEPVETDLDGEDLALGAGANFNTEVGVTIRGEFEWFDIEDTDGVWLFSVSAIYNF